MEKREDFRCRVLYKTIEKPVDVGIFHNDGFFSAAEDDCRSFCERLDSAGIKFSVVNHSPPIIVSITEADLLEMEKAGILCATYDSR